MQPLRWERRPDGLRAPALVCAFKGWNDAGESATSALTFLGGSLDAERFAVIDPEEFVDFQSARPPRSGAPLRPRAGDALAYVLPRRGRAGRGAGRPAGRHVGRAPRRRAALAPGVGDRLRVRSGTGRAAGPRAHDLRGTDGDRRRPARRVRPG